MLARKRKIRSLLRRGRRARRARFPICGVGRVAGYSVVWDCNRTPLISPKEHQKERCGHFLVAALLHYFSWCALEYSVAGRISCYVSHDNTRTSVCQLPFAKKFLLLLLLNRIDSIPASEKAGHCDLRILRLKRIANTAGVRTHGEMSVSALRLYCSFCCWGIPTPLSC